MNWSNCWKGVGASVIGHDHLRREMPLQDASAAILVPRPAAVVCDGAGSALMSHDGAKAAVREFRIAVSAMEPLLADSLDSERTPWGFADDLWRYTAGWIVRALAAARDEAAREGTGCPEDYSFTFAAAVVGRLRTGFVQVGDGAICVKTRCGCNLAFKPEKGRYANMTPFLGAETVENDSFLTRVVPTSAIRGLMVMSDGPEVNMVDMTTMRPAPVVAMMIDDCASGEMGRDSLLNYLTGSRWYGDSRGGDDKSIVVLASEVTINEVKQDEHR